MNHLGCLFILLLLCIPASALTVELPAKVLPGESFNVVVKLNDTSVVGLTFEVPDRLKLVNCSVPYRMAGESVALAIVNESKAVCSFKALESGNFRSEIRWIDFLSNESGTIVKYVLVGNKTPSVTPTVTPTVTPIPQSASTPAAPKATPTQEIPGFGFTIAILAIILALRRR